DSQTWGKLPYIIKLGNLGVHTNKTITNSEATLSLASLFEFIAWIDYCYGQLYEERTFDEQLIPTEQVDVDVRRIKETQGLLSAKESEIERLRSQVEALSKQLTQDKEQHQAERTFT